MILCYICENRDIPKSHDWEEYCNQCNFCLDIEKLLKMKIEWKKQIEEKSK
jgi:hypothetical protein